MTRLTILHLLCSTLRVTRAVQKSWLWQRGSLYIFLSVRLPLCIPLHASMESVFIPPCVRVELPGAQRALLWEVVLDRVPTLGPSSPTRNLTRMCAHIHANPLILPPVLLSISVSWRVDGCWRGGKDDGSSCRDRIGWDPLEGVIRLLWNLMPIRPSLEQRGGGLYSQMQCKVQVLSLSLPPIASSYLPLYLLLSHTNKHTHYVLYFMNIYTSRHAACTASWHQNLLLGCFEIHEHTLITPAHQWESCCKNIIMYQPLGQTNTQQKVNVHARIDCTQCSRRVRTCAWHLRLNNAHLFIQQVSKIKHKNSVTLGKLIFLSASTAQRNKSQHSGYFTFAWMLLFDGV